MPESGDLRATLARLGLAVVGVIVLGLVAGWLFGRTSPERAASTLVSDLVITEAVGEEQLDPAAPTSGDPEGPPVCGVQDDPVSPQRQIASLDAGVVLVQYRPSELAADEVEMLRSLAERGRPVLVAPNPDLGAAVVGTAWTRRLGLEAPNQQLLAAFITAYGAPDACEGA